MSALVGEAAAADAINVFHSAHDGLLRACGVDDVDGLPHVDGSFYEPQRVHITERVFQRGLYHHRHSFLGLFHVLSKVICYLQK